MFTYSSEPKCHNNISSNFSWKPVRSLLMSFLHPVRIPKNPKNPTSILTDSLLVLSGNDKTCYQHNFLAVTIATEESMCFVSKRVIDFSLPFEIFIQIPILPQHYNLLSAPQNLSPLISLSRFPPLFFFFLFCPFCLFFSIFSHNFTRWSSSHIRLQLILFITLSPLFPCCFFFFFF